MHIAQVLERDVTAQQAVVHSKERFVNLCMCFLEENSRFHVPPARTPRHSSCYSVKERVISTSSPHQLSRFLFRHFTPLVDFH
jgi:hypothetical protein